MRFNVYLSLFVLLVSTKAMAHSLSEQSFTEGFLYPLDIINGSTNGQGVLGIVLSTLLMQLIAINLMKYFEKSLHKNYVYQLIRVSGLILVVVAIVSFAGNA